MAVSTLHNGTEPLLRRLRAEAEQFQSLAQTRRKISYPSSSFIPGCGFTASFHCTGAAGKGDVMSIISNKASFVIAAAVVGAVSLMSFAASAGPLTLKKPCIGCNPNTWTSGHNHHWNGGGGYYGGGPGIKFAAPAGLGLGQWHIVSPPVFLSPPALLPTL